MFRGDYRDPRVDRPPRRVSSRPCARTGAGGGPCGARQAADGKRGARHRSGGLISHVETRALKRPRTLASSCSASGPHQSHCPYANRLQPNCPNNQARATGIEPATTGSTVRYSNQLSYAPGLLSRNDLRPASSPLRQRTDGQHQREVCLVDGGSSTPVRQLQRRWGKTAAKLG